MSSTPRRSSARRTSGPPPSRSGSRIQRRSKPRTTPRRRGTMRSTRWCGWPISCAPRTAASRPGCSKASTSTACATTRFWDPATPHSGCRSRPSSPTAPASRNCSRRRCARRRSPGPQETIPDEGAYFSDSADLSDNTVALMRQVEGRIKLYRDAIAAAQATLATLRAGHRPGQRRARGDRRCAGRGPPRRERGEGAARRGIGADCGHQSTPRQGDRGGSALPGIRATPRGGQPGQRAQAPGRSRLDRSARTRMPRRPSRRARRAHRPPAGRA